MIGETRVLADAGGGCHLFSGCGFPAPGLQDFQFKPLFSIGSFHFTKPELVAVLCMITVTVFFWAAFAKPKLVPRGVQNIGELGILAVRDQILRPALGRRGDTYLPFLVSLFFYIFLMNLMELIPVFQFPSMSRIGFVWPMVAIVYLLYIYLGFKHQGGWGYISNMWPHDVPLMILPLLIPVELLRFFIIQPFTLGIRLFANMFAGHLLLAIFMIATWYLMSFSIGLLFAAGSAVMVLFVFLLELLVDLLQAFIFTTLTATYIASSLEAAH
ncbi:MAG TPA: F0F1 ATP synthase subunit A [Streptosporangiaceae bacterium]